MTSPRSMAKVVSSMHRTQATPTVSEQSQSRRTRWHVPRMFWVDNLEWRSNVAQKQTMSPTNYQITVMVGSAGAQLAQPERSGERAHLSSD